MALFEMMDNCLVPISPTSFSAEGIKERYDLQRLLRDRIEIIAPGAMVLAEEFGDWEDSGRRIDLLCLDRDGTLVVVELKRSDDGGFMDLQALRYAAMVSSMTFEQAVAAHTRYLKLRGREDTARESIMSHLDGSMEHFAEDVRIVLVSADFSKELTTSIIWLNQRELDIRSVRIKPHRLGDRLVLDVQQIIPLPEAADYQIRIREKLQQERLERQQSRDFTRYDVTVNGEIRKDLNKRMAAFYAFRAICLAGVAPEDIAEALSNKQMFVSAPGKLSGTAFREALANQNMTQDKISRYFAEDEELIHIGDRTYAITKMWGGDMEGNVKKALEAYPTPGVVCVVSNQFE